MSHTFLLQPSSWIIKGNVTDKNQIITPFKGATIIAWDQSSWFTMKTKLVFENNHSSSENAHNLEFEYKGFLPNNKYSYSYVLKRSDFDKIEGEGWITKSSIIQRYWILGDSRRRSVLETMFQLDEDNYHFSSTMIAGNNMVNVTEGVFERHG
ncbi:hypothetical protein IQ215_04585 [Cyanobacterium stanieri LEGE 03274]|uniref:Uncharacterized protein n=1 Tax=Cyanobacterium stanieri LEGE 03274 TaxID=1828756 RepID=A0ABR9V249_9CHRO|nr:hypothetical protein [Cyanobacterium stanieri]MBE9221969.1 hypothetical protein [Cyanobacterium stanieri LEGE 03274]